MADKQSDPVKKSSQNRKRRKSKSSKRKSEKSYSSKNSEKFNSPKDERNSSIKDVSKNDSYSKSNFIFKSDQNEQQESSSTKDVTQRHVNKFYKHNYSPSYAVNGDSPHAYRNRIDYCENLEMRDPTVFTNRFSDHSLRPLNNFQHASEEFDYVNNEIDFLRQENMRLTNALHNFQPNWEVESSPEVDIIFKNRTLAEKFSPVVNKLISKLLSGKITVEELEKFCDESRKSPEPLDECLFAVDSSADLSLNSSALNSSIPVYDASFDQILESADDSKNATPQKSSGRLLNCFNCDGDHHMSKCPYKLNYRKIATAKRQAKSHYVPNVRYHVHGKNESDFKPGVISDELRAALGLEKDQLPEYIYRMRVLDYPPGWLYEAAVESSGVVLYDSEGNALKEENCEDGEVDTSEIRVQYDPDKLIDYPGFNVPPPPNVIEESEVFGLPPLQPHQLRSFVEKFMAKPDVRPSRKRKINLPNQRPRKIQRMEEDMEIADDSDNDGRIEITNDFIPPLPAESAPPPPPPPPPPPGNEVAEEMILSKLSDNRIILEENSASFSDSAPNFARITSCSEFSSGTSSPSLAELEELKKKLVMQLDNSGDDEPYYEPSDDPPLDDDEFNSSVVVVEDDKTSDSLYILDECVASDLSNLSSRSNSDSLEKSDVPECSQNKTVLQENSPENSQDKSHLSDSLHSLERTTSQSKMVALGTPSLSRHSPFVKLPDYEKFSKDVSAHLPFENLPNSTGTYEKMKNVVKKVRDKLSSLMN